MASEVAQAAFEGNKETIYWAMLKTLKKGNPRVFKELAERGFGTLTQRAEIGGLENLAEQISEARKRAMELPESQRVVAGELENPAKDS